MIKNKAGTPDAPLHILYFAWLRERLGRAEEYLAIPKGVTDVSGLLEVLCQRDPGMVGALGAEMRVRCAVNQEFAGLNAPIAAGDEIAFFPPVTGG